MASSVQRGRDGATRSSAENTRFSSRAEESGAATFFSRRFSSSRPFGFCASDTSSPPYFAFHREEVCGLIPCRRQASSVVPPASCSRNTPMFCSRPSPWDDGLSLKTRDQQGGRSQPLAHQQGRAQPCPGDACRGGLGARDGPLRASASGRGVATRSRRSPVPASSPCSVGKTRIRIASGAGPSRVARRKRQLRGLRPKVDAGRPRGPANENSYARSHRLVRRPSPATSPAAVSMRGSSLAAWRLAILRRLL
jgi:hypothetical protein